MNNAGHIQDRLHPGYNDDDMPQTSSHKGDNALGTSALLQYPGAPPGRSEPFRTRDARGLCVVRLVEALLTRLTSLQPSRRHATRQALSYFKQSIIIYFI